MLLDESWKRQEKSPKEMEKMLTIRFPFLKEDQEISQIYELYLLPITEALAEIKTEVSRINEVRVDDESSNSR